jgi:hypothetical protein
VHDKRNRHRGRFRSNGSVALNLKTNDIVPASLAETTPSARCSIASQQSHVCPWLTALGSVIVLMILAEPVPVAFVAEYVASTFRQPMLLCRYPSGQQSHIMRKEVDSVVSTGFSSDATKVQRSTRTACNSVI